MGASASVDVPEATAGETVEVSVVMQAPRTAGQYTGVWQLCDATVCYPSRVTVQVVVPGAATATPVLRALSIPVTLPTEPPARMDPRAGCDSSYPDVCIPPLPPDLDCPEIPYRPFRVIGPDPHNFDGDHDGVGCESG